MGWLKRVLRYLAHFPEKGRMIILGKKLYLHGASDADWGGEEMSMKSTTSAYLALGDYGVVELQQAPEEGGGLQHGG